MSEMTTGEINVSLFDEVKKLQKALHEQIEHTNSAYRELEEVREHYKKCVDDLRERLIDDTMG